MALDVGTRFGPYEVVEPIGSGGMGEVWRAKDLKLKREVAVKLLPESFAADADRLARFQREAELLAAINHPNIASIYGLEQFHDQTIIVMELVDGSTLADLMREGPLPLDDAMAIALQIVSALEAAHDKQIVHRDLKPENVKVKGDGTVKVLDFGIAKPIHPQAISGGRPVTATPAVTETGVILGTAAYMSPEQARGKIVDERTDIWAFGCLFFEMLTGQPAFAGEDVAVTLARILERDPDVAAAGRALPERIRRTIELCLKKDPKHRLADIRDVRLALEGELWPEPQAAAAAASRARAWLAIAGALAAAAIATWAFVWSTRPALAPTAVAEYLLAVQPFSRPSPDGARALDGPVARPEHTEIALTPDESTLVYTRWTGPGLHQTQLFRRRLDSLEAVPLAGTEGAHNPAISPDGAEVAFWAEGELKRVPLAGGPVTKIVDIPDSAPRFIYGASWGDGDHVVFATERNGLWQVHVPSGESRQIAVPGEDETIYRHPHLLPGGDALLYTAQKHFSRWSDSQVVVRSMDSDDLEVLFDDAADARYISTGHIVFLRRGTLWMAPFDLETWAAGEPEALLNDVMQRVNVGFAYNDTGAAQVAIGSRGTFVYVTGGQGRDVDAELVWVDRSGSAEPVANIRPDEFVFPRVAGNGQIVVGTLPNESGASGRLWIYNSRQTFLPWTDLGEHGEVPAWSNDDETIIYGHAETGDANLFRRRTDRADAPEQLHPSDYSQVAGSASADGIFTYVEVGGTEVRVNLWALDLEDLAAAPARLDAAIHPEFAPNSNLLAYMSGAAGTRHVYVARLPSLVAGLQERVQVTLAAGGHSPTWREDGRELYYVIGPDEQGRAKMMSVEIEVDADGNARPGETTELFELDGSYAAYGEPVRSYDVRPDGERFLFIRRLGQPPEPPAELRFVRNWFEAIGVSAQSDR